jgi:hypothetical protein
MSHFGRFILLRVTRPTCVASLAHYFSTLTYASFISNDLFCSSHYLHISMSLLPRVSSLVAALGMVIDPSSRATPTKAGVAAAKFLFAKKPTSSENQFLISKGGIR